jgi:hypothetical protein
MSERCSRQVLVGLFEQSRELLFGAGVSGAPQRGFHFPPKIRIAAQSPSRRLILEKACNFLLWVHRLWLQQQGRLSLNNVRLAPSSIRGPIPGEIPEGSTMLLLVNEWGQPEHGLLGMRRKQRR